MSSSARPHSVSTRLTAALGLMMANPGTPLRAILDTEHNDSERIRRIYLLVLSRAPSPAELSTARQHVHQSRAELEGYEDFMWALCNTTEFMSNH